ncbi:MAG: hypothetical protein ACI8ZM_001534 [Crocinitomix sp.]|jgi:hypothetical protein
MMNLRNICISGLIVSTLVVFKNLLSKLYPLEFESLLTSNPGISVGFIIEYTLIYAHFIILLIYLHKKRYIVAALVWLVQVFMFTWFFYFMHHYYNSDVELMNFVAKIKMSIQMMAIMTLITGTIFVISYSRARIWLRVFGYMMILGAIPMLKEDLMREYLTVYIYFSAFIPAPLIINYWLELKKLKADQNVQESDVLDNDLEPIV